VVILAVGAVWGCDYELCAHSAAAWKAGISESAIRTLAAGGLPDDLSEQEQVAQRSARLFSAEHRVDAALYGAAVHAFGEQGVVDLTYLIGIYHITCGLLNSHAMHWVSASGRASALVVGGRNRMAAAANVSLAS
jgi:4-carboxymuconolactone decarboxylase